MGRYALLFEHVPARRDKPARVLDFNSIQDVHHYHRGFLADGEHVAQISLSLGEIGLGLCTGTTQGSKLGLDLILVGVLVLESGSKIAEFELDIGLRLALVRAAWPVALVWWAAWAATIGRPTAGPTWAAAIRSAWATEASGSTGSARATHTAAAGVALKLAHLVDRRLQRFPFCVSGTEHFLHSVLHSLAHLRRIGWSTWSSLATETSRPSAVSGRGLCQHGHGEHRRQ
jgi:hypothetical protein